MSKHGLYSAALLLSVGLLGIALTGGGCLSSEPFRPAHLSGNELLVGGGLKIAWKAPEPGTAYLVEEETGKLVETVSLAEGEPYLFAVESIVEADDLEEMLGIEVGRAQFLLYFEPVEQSGSAGQEVD